MEVIVGNSIQIKKTVDAKELAAFFCDLADAVENGGKGDLAGVKEFGKIKISVKNEFGQISLKAKIKPSKPCDVETEKKSHDTPKYKHLKKRMKSSFKLLVKMIHDNQVPPKEAVHSFLEDSKLMVSYPGYGDEYYDDYTKACEVFKMAFESGDVSKMHGPIDFLVHEKSRCHAKYD